FIVKQLGSEVKILDPILIQHGVEKISNNNYLLTAMIIYYIQYEFARTPIDILRRRTWIMLEKGNGLNILDQVIDIMTSELNWDDKTKNMMKKRTIDYINNFMKIT
ncbi:MAG: glycerol-3-phosphate dehydrogenase C-terminal domain-containing protein, partial [Candidatus Heimdallarchaeota archaeon]